eukprot:jgi/Astpho2/1527/Aster-05401
MGCAASKPDLISDPAAVEESRHVPRKGTEPLAGQQQIKGGAQEAADTKPQPRQKSELCRADSARSDRGSNSVAAGATHAGQRPNGTAVSGIGSSDSDAEAAAVLARRMSEAQPLAERGDTAAADDPNLGMPQPFDPRRGAPLPANAAARQEELDSLKILDTARDQNFDDVTKLVSSIFDVPIALVSLVDRERQWFKSVVGLQTDCTDRASSFCAWTLLPQHPEVLVVPDATQDIRFQDNPLVTGEPYISFYAGAPLVTSTGHRLGSLCVIDKKPRHFDAESCNLLCNFAEVVVREIEKEKLRANESMRLSRQTSGLLRALDCFSQGIMLVDTSTSDWSIVFVNDAWVTITGIQREKGLSGAMWQLCKPARAGDEAAAMKAAQEQVDQQSSFDLNLVQRTPTSAETIRFTAHFKPAGSDQLDADMPTIGIPGFVEWAGTHAGMHYFAVVEPSPDLAADEESLQAVERQDPFHDVQLGPLLGQGAFGKVYRGMWNGAAVAVKVIQHTQQLSPDSPASLGAASSDVIAGDQGQTLTRGAGSLSPQTRGKAGELEGMLSRDLSHPNIVQTYKSVVRPMAGKEDYAGKRFLESWLVLEFCDRGSLQDSVDKGTFFLPRAAGEGPPQPNMKAITNTAREIASALMYLHSRDVLHGDLTGGNILLISSDTDERGFTAKVADFGLSRMLGSEAVNTGTYGTVTHMPPELLTTGQLIKACDVYSFGQRPWGGLMQMQIIFHVTIQKKRLQYPEDTPAEFKELGLACMDSDPEARPNFQRVLEMLERVPC